MPAQFYMGYMDYDKEISGVKLEGATLSAANFDAQVTLWNTLQAAMNVVTLGSPTRRAISHGTYYGDVPPTDPTAQRESKWLVTYRDDSSPGRKLTAELPCADLGPTLGLLMPHTKQADLTVQAWIDFVTAFEAVVKAPITGGDVTVLDIRHVGRNL